MGRHLFGVETELALVAEGEGGQALPVDKTLSRFQKVAYDTLRHLPDERGGMFLENGARFYRDSGGGADHMEFATPETANPWDTVRYVLAGEALAVSVAEQLVQEQPDIGRVRIMKHNANYGKARGSAWGTHESYLNEGAQGDLQSQLMSFLVSRVVFTGSGGFDPFSPGIRFLLSPRVAHLTREVSGDTTQDRPIFNTKNESLCGMASSFRRLHLICGESNCSQTSMWLKSATTSLVVAMIEAGLPVGREVQLLQPLAAMRRFAADPELRKSGKSQGGSLLTALQIQRHYLEFAETHVGKEFMPEWSDRVCELWRALLDELEERGKEGVSTRLDWAIKHALFTRYLESHEWTWELVEKWNKLSMRVQRDLERSEYGVSGIHGIYLESDMVSHPNEALKKSLDSVDKARLASFLKLRNELFEIDLRFMTVGEGGLFSQLDRAGVLRHQVPGVDNIPHAMKSPPRGSRASLRGKAVSEKCEGKEKTPSLCQWSSVRAGDKILDLRDPFAAEAVWEDRENHELDLLGDSPSLALRRRLAARMAAEREGF